VATHRKETDREVDLRAAAQAAASWAHARRSTWTDAPLPRHEIEAVTIEPPRPIPIPEVHPEPPSPEPERPERSMFADAARSATALAVPAARWIAIAGVVAAGGAALFVGGRKLWTAASTTIASRTARAASPSSAANGRGNVPAVPKTGTIHVVSTPSGARVLVDGKFRGSTPTSIEDVAPGKHEVAIESDAGSVRRSVAITAGQTAELDESIFSGWAVVIAPFEFVVSENGHTLSANERFEIMLSPGTHQLRITNRALSFDTVQRVEIKPGEAANIRITPPPSSLTVTASDPAEVWVDGVRFGDTPLSNAPVPLGTHQLQVKRAAGGERRFTIVVGVRPYTLNVDFQQ